jgi:hypothetical protein
MALAAGPADIFQDREDVVAGGLAGYRLYRCETSLEMRQVFVAGPDHEGRNVAATFGQRRGFPLEPTSNPMSRPRKTRMEEMSEWVLHCAVNQRHIRRSQPTREAALKDACSQLLEGHAVNRIVGPNETINAKQITDWCAKHRP